MARIELLTCRFAPAHSEWKIASLFEEADKERQTPFELIPLNWSVELRGFEPRTSCMPWNAGPFTTVRDSSLATRLSRSFVQIGPLPFTRVHRGR